MKMTVVVDAHGRLVAAQGPGKDAGLVAGPNQRLHQVEVPDHVDFTDPDRFHGQLSAIVKDHLESQV